MPDTPKTSPETLETASVWLSVAAFAQARGCSIRSVKRYIENGEVETRKDGARRFVRPLEEGHKGDTEGAQQKGHAPEVVSLSRSVHAQSEGHAQGTQRDTEGTQPVSLSPMNASEVENQLRADLQRERENAAFLRGVIEQLQRDAIELRAIARDALRMAPKQLSAGGHLAQLGTDSSARNAPDRAQKGEANNVPSDAQNAPESKRAPLSYASIADEIERRLSRPESR